MPASYHISPLIACIIVRLEDSVSDHDLIEGQRRMFSDPLFKGHYSRLVDATEVTEFAVSAETVRAFGHRGRRTRLAEGRAHLKRHGFGL